MSDEKVRSGKVRGAMVISLLLLFLPNVNLIDVFPDFIAYFILARIFGGGSDCAPYFEEARIGFVKLAFLNLAKLPALLLISFVRSGNTLDYDVIALFSFAFAIGEVILLAGAVKNSFDALFYLGQRSDASALIKSDSVISPDALRSFTMLFAIFKCMLYSLPELLRLTKSVEGGYMMSGSKFYAPTLLASLALGTVIGTIWLVRTIKYVNAIEKEGKFFSALAALAEGSSEAELDKRLTERKLSGIFLYFIAAAVLSFDLIFDNYKGVNLLPSFVFAALFLIGTLKLASFSERQALYSKLSLIFGIGYVIASATGAVLEFRFLDKYGYEALIYNEQPQAHKLYSALEAVTVVETLLALALIAVFFFIMKSYTTANLGLSKDSPSYRRFDAEYHRTVNVKTGVFAILSSLVAIVRLIDVYAKGNATLIFTDENNVLMPVIVGSSLPWLNVVCAGVSITLTVYAIYYFNYLKEEKAQRD